MIAERLQGLWFLGLMLTASCTGMLHEVSGRKSLDVATTATFNMFTNSSYDTPTADWEVVTTDDNFLYYECLVERTSQVTDEVTETGIWETCESPYDLREAPGIDVEEGFNGQLTVRAVSRTGTAGESITKPFRRALWAGGVDGSVYSIAASSGTAFIGGDFTGIRDASSQSMRRIGRLNSDGSVDLSSEHLLKGFDYFASNVIAVQDDGKILVGGDLPSASAPNHFLRLHSNGSLDGTFTGLTSGFDDPVYAIAIQNDGKILVGGSFTSYNGGASAPDCLIRLNSDGTIDGTFAGLTSGFDGAVLTVAIQDDDKILVGGTFTTYNGGAAPGRLIRLNADGAIDTTFTGITTGFGGTVRSIALQSDGKILVGGGFTSYNGSGTAPDRLIRLNSDGSVDSTFTGLSTGFDVGVYRIVIQDDGKILVGGDFTTYNGAAAPDRLVRLNADGTIDATFTGLISGFDDLVRSVAVQNDGKILVGGEFLSYNGSASAPDSLIRLNADGTIDHTFVGLKSGFNGWVRTLSIQEDGKILVGGDFTSYNGSAAAPGRLKQTGLDGIGDSAFTGLTSGFDNRVRAIAIQNDGKILLGGLFTSYNGGAAAPDRLIRLNPDGTVDGTFSGLTTGFDSAVMAIVIQSDGKILVGGNFTTYNGGAAPDRLIRLNTDGSIDGTFTGLISGFDSIVRTIALQSDGKILVGGTFTSYNGSGAVPDRLIRLNADGTVDATFTGVTSGFNSDVDAIAIQDDGKILVGGAFISFNGNFSAPDFFIRLNSNGSIDGTFTGLTTGFNQPVAAIAIQGDGKILVGGYHEAYNGGAAPDRLIRLNLDGTIDGTFTGLTSGLDTWVRAIAIQNDGKILVGGDFTSYNGDASAPDRIMRLNIDGSIDQSFMGQRK